MANAIIRLLLIAITRCFLNKGHCSVAKVCLQAEDNFLRYVTFKHLLIWFNWHYKFIVAILIFSGEKSLTNYSMKHLVD